MTDFLKANPYVSREEYMWEWTVPQVRLSSFDFTHTVYMRNDGDKERRRKRKVANARKINSADDLINDLGVPITAITKK